MLKSKRKMFGLLILASSLLVMFCVHFVRSNPIIFNESFFSHAHCIKQAMMYLINYASVNDERLPFHEDGYGDAVLLIPEVWLECFSGPGYDTKAWEEARRTGSNVPEDHCGRVYVQGLSLNDNPNIAILFDKQASPVNHCHFFRRIFAPRVREVLTIGGTETVHEKDWSEFARNQIELLVKAGIPREQAEKYYAEVR